MYVVIFFLNTKKCFSGSSKVIRHRVYLHITVVILFSSFSLEYKHVDKCAESRTVEL